MEYIHRLPFIFGALAAITAALVSYMNDMDQKAICLRMAISMIVFFAIGIASRNMLNKITNEQEEKKRLQELEEQLRLEQEEQSEERNLDTESEDPKPTLDYRIDDYGEDFSPLSVSEVIRSELNKE